MCIFKFLCRPYMEKLNNFEPYSSKISQSIFYINFCFHFFPHFSLLTPPLSTLIICAYLHPIFFIRSQVIGSSYHYQAPTSLTTPNLHACFIASSFIFSFKLYCLRLRNGREKSQGADQGFWQEQKACFKTIPQLGLIRALTGNKGQGLLLHNP